MCSPSTQESIVNHMWVWFSHSHNNWKLLWLLKANQITNQTVIWNVVSKQLGDHYYSHTGVWVCWCGVVIDTQVGWHYEKGKQVEI